ncbi:MAG: hypothetical protein QF441_09815 [Bacteriovoracaceae bacterium]|jgi:hypothetical protein|nr:hypothetical protein [Bacteriovoracaceae bacterium]
MKLLFILSLICFALTPPRALAYYWSFGTYVPYFNQAQTSPGGATKKFEINPTFGVGTQLQMVSRHYFSPEFGFTYFLDNAKNTKRDMIHLNYNFSYIMGNNFTLRYGLSNHWYRLHGLGGSVYLDNGNGTTKFPSPDKTKVSYFSTLNLGTEYLFPSKKYSVRFDLQILSFQRLENKAYNYLLSFNYYR